MAYVKLPGDIRRLNAASIGGARGAELEFTVFAGSARPDQADRSLELASARRVEIFDASDAPLSFRKGDLGAVVAVSVAGKETGPIIAAANIDRDARADLISREPELASMLGLDRARGGPVKRAARGLGGLIVSAIVIALAAAAAYVLGVLALEWRAIAAAGAPVERFELLVAALSTPSLAVAAPVVLAAALAFVGRGVRSVARGVARRRDQRRALNAVWSRVADILLYVQGSGEAFRAAPARPQADPGLKARLGGVRSRHRVAREQRATGGVFDGAAVAVAKETAASDRGLGSAYIDGRAVARRPGAVPLPRFLAS